MIDTKDQLEDQEHLEYRFYGRRQGHALRPNRQRLVDDLLPKILISIPTGGSVLDLGDLFDGPKKAYWLEIGFGGGEHLAALAKANPDIGFIGCEPFINGVANLLAHVDENNLENVRIYNDDVRDLFPALPSNTFERLYLPYADPWRKKKHHRRRMVQTETLETFSRLLIDGGEFRYASDFMDYVRWTLGLVAKNVDFEWTAKGPSDWRTRPHDSIETRYEAKAKRKGSKCVYLTYKRKAR